MILTPEIRADIEEMITILRAKGNNYSQVKGMLKTEKGVCAFGLYVSEKYVDNETYMWEEFGSICEKNYYFSPTKEAFRNGVPDAIPFFENDPSQGQRTKLSRLVTNLNDEDDLTFFEIADHLEAALAIDSFDRKEIREFVLDNSLVTV